MVLTFPSQPSKHTAVVVEKSRAGPTHRRDLKFAEVKAFLNNQRAHIQIVLNIMHIIQMNER